MSVSKQEILEALLEMCQQYLSDGSGGMTHSFMSAGEHALDVLEREGVVEEIECERYQIKEVGDV